MFDVICDESSILQMMSRFGIPVGVGDKSVRETCKEHDVDATTFLALANYLKLGNEVSNFFIDKLSVESLLDYLQKSHSYFLDFQIPNIRRKLIEAIDVSKANDVPFLILKFFDEFAHDVNHHMKGENESVFTNVRSLLKGKKVDGFNIADYCKSHVGMDLKLQELKKVIIKYYKSAPSTEMLNNVLFDIFNFEEDLKKHCHIEDDLFVPAVELVEKKVKLQSNNAPEENDKEELSDREKDIVIEIVKGKTNKEVAADLFISVNTVLTHRKNISRKLGIHSVAGLTIYAIVNGLIQIDDVKE